MFEPPLQSQTTREHLSVAYLRPLEVRAPDVEAREQLEDLIKQAIVHQHGRIRVCGMIDHLLVRLGVHLWVWVKVTSDEQAAPLGLRQNGQCHRFHVT
jgi:hypothetical protein